MKKLFAVAALLLASTAAQAQYTFEYGGRTIRIDPDRGTVSIPGVYDNTGRKAKRSRDDQDSDRPRKQAPQQAKNDPQAPAAEPAPAPVQQAPAAADAFNRAFQRPPRLSHRRMPPLRHSLQPARPRRSLSRMRHPLRTRAAAQPAPAPVVATAPPAPAAARSEAAGTRPRGGQLAARRLADRREGRQGPDRAMRPQSLRIFRGRQVEPERRTGPDQHEARQGLQMERANSRPEFRQHL